MPLPLIRGLSTPLLPFTRTLRTFTRVAAFENGRRQTMVIAPPRMDFVLPYSSLSAVDVDLLRVAHVAAKGQLDSTLSLSLGTPPVVYTNLAFVDGDTFSSEEYSTTRYRSEFKLRQTKPQALPANANGGVYPTILAQLPYTREHRFSTYVTDQESGPRYAFGLYETALVGFPDHPPFACKIQYDLLSDVELALLEPFFVAMNGRYGTFQFTDPDSLVVYERCFFDFDDLEIRYTEPGLCSVSVSICEQWLS